MLDKIGTRLPGPGEYSMERINAALTAVDEWKGSPAAGNIADYA